MNNRLLTTLATTAVLFGFGSPTAAVAAHTWPLWQNKRAVCQVVLPTTDEPAARLASGTLTNFLQSFYGVDLPQAADAAHPGTYLVLGRPENNPTLAGLVRAGLKLNREAIGDEGFQLLAHE